MLFYKIIQYGKNYTGKPRWVTKDENKFGEIWINVIHGGWCTKNKNDKILKIADYPDKDSFIDYYRQEIYSYLIKEDSDLGWLSPDGRFYGCDWADHEMVATEYFGRRDACELEKEGWVRVFRSVETKEPVYAQYKITEYQRVWLEDHCIEYACC